MAPRAFRSIESVPKADLRLLLDEEGVMWARDLAWGFEPTKHRIESAFDEGALKGLVAYDDLGACAYATYAVDGHRGVIGSIFAAERARLEGLEAILVERILRRLELAIVNPADSSGTDPDPPTIDCQTLFSSDRELSQPFRAMGFDSATRVYMDLEKEAWRRPERSSAILPAFRRFARFDISAAAQLVYEAHRETCPLDACSSFDTRDSCERILRQIVIDEVCGSFDPSGSRVVENDQGMLALVILTWPYPAVAHLSEVATATPFRRRGLGRECLAEALSVAFDQGGAKSVTLSVTASNHAAIALYDSLGFRPRVPYLSHVWRGPRA